jgi:endonuclease-3
MNFDRQKTTWKKIWPVLKKRYARTKTFLNYTNTWELLVAVILSAQMTDDGVNAISGALFKKFSTPHIMARASIAEITKYVKKVNYFNAKARYLKKTAQLLVQNFNGQVPDTVDELLTLSGVGRKTAVAVLANGFGKYVGIAVDTHVIRFVHRYGLSRSKNPTKIEEELMQIIPNKDWNAASYAIKEYGRREGKARPWKPEIDPVWEKYKQ